MRLLTVLSLIVALMFAAAWSQTYYRLPGAQARESGGAIVLETQTGSITYVPGMGWLEPIDAPPPLLVDGAVLGTRELIAALGITVPVLEDVRFGGDAAVRIVLEFSGFADATDFRPLAQRGVIELEAPLVLELPELLLPATPVDPQRNVDVVLEPIEGATRLSVYSSAATYEVFALEGPTRLVIDVVPQPETFEREAIVRDIAPGIRYQRFVAPNGMGLTVVHAVEVAPGAGQVRVVGENGVPRTVAELASGAVVAINAGYFDPATFAAIGLLTVDHGLLSFPSRNRAAFAATGGALAIARVSATVDVAVDGVRVVAAAVEDAVRYVDGFDGLAGEPDKGLLVVVDGVVTQNMVGPRVVPAEGFGLVYDPALRPLALVDPGQRIDVDVRMRPAMFQGARYAVEAGPLLVENGAPAFDPAQESFARGQRILDAYTQQAGVGLRPDGTLLMVVAETMRAEDLVGVFLELGADAAMRLDSGSSTALLIDGDAVNRAVSRRVVSAIVVRTEPVGTAPRTP